MAEVMVGSPQLTQGPYFHKKDPGVHITGAVETEFPSVLRPAEFEPSHNIFLMAFVGL